MVQVVDCKKQKFQSKSLYRVKELTLNSGIIIFINQRKTLKQHHWTSIDSAYSNHIRKGGYDTYLEAYSCLKKTIIAEREIWRNGTCSEKYHPVDVNVLLKNLDLFEDTN